MSKLDDILFDPAETIHEEWCIDEHPKDSVGMVENHLKEQKIQIKDLFLEVIQDELLDPEMTHVNDYPTWWDAVNGRLSTLSEKVKEL